METLQDTSGQNVLWRLHNMGQDSNSQYF